MPGKFLIRPAKDGGWDISLKSDKGEIHLTTVVSKATPGIEPVNAKSSQGYRYELKVSPSGKVLLVPTFTKS